MGLFYTCYERNLQKALREMMSDFTEEDWAAITEDGTEPAAFIYHRPGSRKHEQAYVVVHSLYEDRQK